MDDIASLQQRIVSLEKANASLEAKATTRLSGTEFLLFVIIVPVIAAFVILGIIIVWKTTSNPESVAPHLDVILLAFAIFAQPVGVLVGAVGGRYSAQREQSKGEEKE